MWCSSCVQLDLGAIPKSARPEGVKENANIFDFELAEEDMQGLSALNRDWHCTWDPSQVL
jgi:methylglyoxal/glyoxal reductase